MKRILVALGLVIFVVFCATASFATDLPGQTQLTLSLGGQSGESFTWIIGDQGWQYTEYARGDGNAHIVLHTLLDNQYYSSISGPRPIPAHEAAINVFVWVDPNYADEYVNVSWALTGNPDYYAWTACERYVGGSITGVNTHSLNNGTGIFQIVASQALVGTYGSRCLNLSASIVPEPSSLIALIGGMVPLAFIKRRKK